MHLLVSRTTLAIETLEGAPDPAALFERTRGRRRPFFLDSARPSGGLGEWSFIGFDPLLTVRAAGGEVQLAWRDGTVKRRSGDPLAVMGGLLRAYSAPGGDGVPFVGGAVGYVSYEWGAARHGVAPAGGGRRTGLPDFEFAFYDGIAACRHGSGECLLVAQAVAGEKPERILARLREGLEGGRRGAEAATINGPTGIAPAEVKASFTREQYLRAVDRIRRYIEAGDIYQANLTQGFEAPLRGSARELYGRLRALNPAPFGCCLEAGSISIASASPERLLRVRGRRAETRPIKGTRPRGSTPAQDARMAAELLASSKDAAELLMIVDLERNDLGRVCEYGSIAMDEPVHLESHPTVHHLVANVVGTLRPEVDALEALAALFPGGSVTGAPKRRALQVLAELERCPRHAYTGAVGYLGFDGNCDFNIAIRSCFVESGRVRFHAGGGVLWDSDPDAEYEEMLAKAKALRAAVTETPA